MWSARIRHMPQCQRAIAIRCVGFVQAGLALLAEGQLVIKAKQAKPAMACLIQQINHFHKVRLAVGVQPAIAGFIMLQPAMGHKGHAMLLQQRDPLIRAFNTAGSHAIDAARCNQAFRMALLGPVARNSG